MNCPECGASVSADDRFCGNCGTPLDASSPETGAGPADTPPTIDEDQATPGPSGNVEPASDVGLPPESGAAAGDQEPVWKAEGPMELPDEGTSVPEPSGLPEGSPVPPQPDTLPGAGIRTGGLDKRLVIAIVVAVILLLCCCIAAIIIGLYAGTEDLASAGASQLMSEIVPDLLAAT